MHPKLWRRFCIPRMARWVDKIHIGALTHKVTNTILAIYVVHRKGLAKRI